MAWIHKVLSKGVDPQNPLVTVVDIQFTDGTTTVTKQFRGVSKAQLIEQVRNHITAFDARDATINDGSIAPDAVLDLTTPAPTPPTQAEINFMTALTRLRQLLEAQRLGLVA